MKSPIRSVGIIEPEGIRNGSTTKALSTKTKAKTGKKDLENLSNILSWRFELSKTAYSALFLLATLYETIMRPVPIDNKKSMAVKSQTTTSC